MNGMDDEITSKVVSEKSEKDNVVVTPQTVTVIDSQKSKVDSTAEQLVQRIIDTDSKEELESLYSQFDINNTKKNAIRINELNNLLDTVNSEAIRRFKTSPDTMSNKEVLDYMTAVQNQIDRSKQVVDGIKEINAVQVNNTQNNTVNINVKSQDLSSMPREKRDRITSFIAEVLKQGDISGTVSKIDNTIDSSDSISNINKNKES